jgi:putative transcriptional regulator
MKKEIEFNEADLISGLQEALAHAKGKLTLRTTKVPRRTLTMSSTSIARIRKALNASTPVFAAYLNVDADTVRGWEKNRRKPSGPALRLLQIASRKPEVLVGEEFWGEFSAQPLTQHKSTVARNLLGTTKVKIEGGRRGLVSV